MEVTNNLKQKLCQKISGEFLWKFLIIEEAGHDDIETEYDDDILDDSIDFINYLSPDDSSSKKVVTVSIPCMFIFFFYFLFLFFLFYFFYYF